MGRVRARAPRQAVSPYAAGPRAACRGNRDLAPIFRRRLKNPPRTMKRSLRSWLWRVPLDQEVAEELELHTELRTRELIARGVDPKTAREMATARIGDVARIKRTCVDLGRKRDREMRLVQWLEEFRHDVTFAIRQLKSAPGFTLVAAITLALGIGANSAMFALADAT